MALDPDDGRRADLRAGQIVAAVYNANRVKGKPSQAHDFFPDTLKPPEKRRQTAEEQRDAMIAWTIALGGRVVKAAK